MGLFDFLFRRKRADAAQPTQAAQPAPDVEEEDEQTVFVSVKLSPQAQANMKRLRELNHNGHAQYRWASSGDVCEACAGHIAAGPYAISAGLTKGAPVPGRETRCGCAVELTGA